MSLAGGNVQALGTTRLSQHSRGLNMDFSGNRCPKLVLDMSSVAARCVSWEGRLDMPQAEQAIVRGAVQALPLDGKSRAD